MFKPGDRVKLIDRIAASLSKQKDWPNRRATVQRVMKTSGDIKILWDDRASPDFWPPRALELAQEQENNHS